MIKYRDIPSFDSTPDSEFKVKRQQLQYYMTQNLDRFQSKVYGDTFREFDPLIRKAIKQAGLKYSLDWHQQARLSLLELLQDGINVAWLLKVRLPQILRRQHQKQFLKQQTSPYFW